MVKAVKTNAVRLLEHAHIPFEAIPYEVDPEYVDANHTAATLGEDINRVFKTLVLRGERNGLFVCVVPGNCEVDLKKAAAAFGDKKAEMIPMRDLLPTTGYVRGGCSPVGMKKQLPTFFHATALDYPTIYVSAGMRGLQLQMSPQDLIKFIGARVADLTK